eukprot:TRINITY_DN27943_c0_g2_i3.p1 TRINITY_DN27943_c0_g2~~TRINITY_DN27943_c0_g2_i3.p1  ORF type:complete len:451 (-),score=32.61 TRINITY_DN27943_c0_g2_i3:147-1499(-)
MSLDQTFLLCGDAQSWDEFVDISQGSCTTPVARFAHIKHNVDNTLMVLVLIAMVIDQAISGWLTPVDLKKLSTFVWDAVDIIIFVMWATVYFLHVEDKDGASFLLINAICLVPGVILLLYGGVHLFWTSSKTNQPAERRRERLCRRAANFLTLYMLVNLVLQVLSSVTGSYIFAQEGGYWLCYEGAGLASFVPPMNTADVQRSATFMEVAGFTVPLWFSGCQYIAGPQLDTVFSGDVWKHMGDGAHGHYGHPEYMRLGGSDHWVDLQETLVDGVDLPGVQNDHPPKYFPGCDWLLQRNSSDFDSTYLTWVGPPPEGVNASGERRQYGFLLFPSQRQLDILTALLISCCKVDDTFAYKVVIDFLNLATTSVDLMLIKGPSFLVEFLKKTNGDITLGSLLNLLLDAATELDAQARQDVETMQTPLLAASETELSPLVTGIADRTSASEQAQV